MFAVFGNLLLDDRKRCWSKYRRATTGFEKFFHGKMEKISGVLPVYQDSAKVYIEIPERLLGRELEIRAW